MAVERSILIQVNKDLTDVTQLQHDSIIRDHWNELRRLILDKVLLLRIMEKGVLVLGVGTRITHDVFEIIITLHEFNSIAPKGKTLLYI